MLVHEVFTSVGSIVGQADQQFNEFKFDSALPSMSKDNSALTINIFKKLFKKDFKIIFQ